MDNIVFINYCSYSRTNEETPSCVLCKTPVLSPLDLNVHWKQHKKRYRDYCKKMGEKKVSYSLETMIQFYRIKEQFESVVKRRI